MFMFDRAECWARNMSEMMDRLGLNTDAFAHRRLWSRFELRDPHLPVLPRGRGDWLARSAKSSAKAPAFCPNATLFAKVHAERGSLVGSRRSSMAVSRGCVMLRPDTFALTAVLALLTAVGPLSV